MSPIPVSKNDILNKLKKELPYLKSHYRVTSLGLFGSTARGENTSLSDVDLLVEFGTPVGWEFFDLKNYLELYLKRRVDLVTKRALKKQLASAILKEVIPVE